jgi:hypothetical protein
VEGNSVRPINYELLAEAAMRYYDDEETLEYLLRSAARLRHGNAEGFVLVNALGEPLHFAWVTAFEAFFLSELKVKVDAPASDCVMLFDCWTPVASRGSGYFGQAITLIAQWLQEHGKKPWIFSVSGNQALLRGLQKTGFHKRYSLITWQILGQRIKGTTPRRVEAPAAEASARI